MGLLVTAVLLFLRSFYRLLSFNRDQESIAVGVRELVSPDIRAVVDGFLHLKSIILLGVEVLHILQHYAFAVHARHLF